MNVRAPPPTPLPEDDVLHLHKAETRARPVDLRSFAIAKGPQELPEGALLDQAGDWLVRAEASPTTQASGSIGVSLKTFTKVAWGSNTASFFNNGWQLGW